MAERVPIYEFELDLGEVAHALWVSEEDALKGLADGRVASRWAEHWGARVGKIVKSTNTNEKGFDLSATVADISIQVSNKCLSNSGVKFQQSRFVGSGRSCTTDDLLASLESTDLVQVVDITGLPKIRLVTVRARDLRKEVKGGRLTPSGWRRASFYDFLKRVYDPEVVRLTRADEAKAAAAA